MQESQAFFNQHDFKCDQLRQGALDDLPRDAHESIFIRFMERLIKYSKKKIFLIVDNLRVHHSAPVKEWVDANKNRIALFYLPSYSPERNPDEYLNGDLKSELGRKAPPMSQSHMEKNLIGSMRRLAKTPQRVAAYFEHPAVAYAKAA